MSSRDHTHGAPYVQKINLSNHDRRTKRRPPKSCPDCNESDNYIRTFSNKVSRIEEIINNYHKNFPKKNKIKQFSTFRTSFTLNNIPCKLEYNLSNFTLENLQKLVIFTTQNCNNKSDKIDKVEERKETEN